MSLPRIVEVKEQQPHGDENSGHIGRESEVTSTNTKLHGLNVMGSVNHTEFAEWVESPIRAHDNKVRLVLAEVEKNKEWVESPIRDHDNEPGMVQVEQKRQDHRPASSKCFHEISGFGLSTIQEVPMSHSGSVPDLPQQAVMNFEVNDTLSSLCAEPVPVLPPACMQHGIGTVEYAQQQNLTWFVVCYAGSPGAFLRHGPDLQAECTGITLLKNEVFSVDQHIASPDGRIYLHLADGRGWAFDDSVLAPEDPSVVRMEFEAVNNPFIPWHTTSTLQHVEQAQFRRNTMGNTNLHHPEPMASSCANCTYPVDARANFCIICGEKQPSPLGIANSGREVFSPYYQYQVHPVSEDPWLEPSTH